MIIYKATNIINNKVYIGQTIKELKIRKAQHERSFNVCQGKRKTAMGYRWNYLD